MSAWSKEDGFCLRQKAVEEKSNEITAIPELLEKLQIKGQIVTVPILYKQPSERNRNNEQGGERPLEYRKHALAFGCNISGRCKCNNR